MATAIEYGLIGSFIAVIAVTAITLGSEQPPKQPHDLAQEEARAAAVCAGWPIKVAEYAEDNFRGEEHDNMWFNFAHGKLLSVSAEGSCHNVGEVSFDTRPLLHFSRIALYGKAGVGSGIKGRQYLLLEIDESAMHRRLFVAASGVNIANRW